MESVWKGVARYNNLTVQQLRAAEMVTLNQFICGFDSSKIEQLNKEAFKFVQPIELTCASLKGPMLLVILVHSRLGGK